MSLTTTPAIIKPRANIINNYLATLTHAERNDALEYLRNPKMYEHQAVADALSDELGYYVSEAAVRRWRRKHA